MGNVGRWAALCLQASLAGALVTSACVARHETARERPFPKTPRTPPDTLVVRTASFSFFMGKPVDATWPDRADATRAALGDALAGLLEDEDASVPLLARQLGVVWPSEPVEFDVVLADPGAEGDCSRSSVPRRLAVPSKGVLAAPFFACVLGRSFTRLALVDAGGSALARGIASTCQGRDAGADERAESLYACIATYAASAVVVSGVRGHSADDVHAARVIESRLGDPCSPAALDWVAREWVKRVREEETAEAFGARAGQEICGARPGTGAGGAAETP